jgi:cytochrome c-type protein NapC
VTGLTVSIAEFRQRSYRSPPRWRRKDVPARSAKAVLPAARVRASCPDCHVPHNWTDKIARKTQASKEVWGKIFGTIDTRQKFLDHRLELAKPEWARLKANDSLECRNCHSAVAMDFTKQTRRASEIHARFLVTGEKTCIDCHKGIAHELPDMTGIEPGWRAPPELRDRQSFRDNPRDELVRYLAATGAER